MIIQDNYELYGYYRFNKYEKQSKCVKLKFIVKLENGSTNITNEDFYMIKLFIII